MPNDHQPKPFTDAQRELFDRNKALNRAKPDDFAEADQWIDTKPQTAVDRAESYRQGVLDEIRERRECTSRIRLTNDFGDRIVLFGGDDPTYGLVPHDGLCESPFWRAYKRWPYHPKVQATVTHERRSRAQNILCGRESHAKWIRDEQKHGPLQPRELLDLAARRFMCPDPDDEPIVFDAMNPQLKALWARRLLRVVWILTDTDDLTATKLAWLREWKWGEHPLEFIGDFPDGPMRPVPRLWLRVTILDRDLEQWEQLTRDALPALEQAEPGAMAISLSVPPTRNTMPHAPDGFYSPTDIAKAMKANAKADAIRMALKRLFDDNRLPDGAWMENSNPARGQAKILYRLSSVRPLLAQPSHFGSANRVL